MTEHELKTWPEFFRAIINLEKPFEIRKDDRDYQVGDILFLREWDHRASRYTDREFRTRITYVLRDAPHFGLMPGFVMLGLDTADILAQRVMFRTRSMPHSGDQGILDKAKRDILENANG